MTNPLRPGVYIEELSLLPPSVAQVETAIPAFIGYTVQAEDKVADDLHLVPKRIKSLAEYEGFYGTAVPHRMDVAIDANDNVVVTAGAGGYPEFNLYYALRHYFYNGGGPCYIVSCGQRGDTVILDDGSNGLSRGLAAIAAEDEPTLLVFPDAPLLASSTDFHDLYDSALDQCATLQDRFTVMDIYNGSESDLDNGVITGSDNFRDGIGNGNLKYGASYFPNLVSLYPYVYETTGPDAVQVDINGAGAVDMETLEAGTDNQYFHLAKLGVEAERVTLPPSAAIAGIYAAVDRNRGVWKAPANVSLRAVFEPTVVIDNDMNDRLNVDGTGKSINAIRSFTGKGILVWGARTLAGNDNEWRYISVRRFYNMVEESVKKASGQFVFEPNDANTWSKVRAMIENFLVLQWRAGALAGAKPEDAFFVKVGLGSTMSPLDILEGRMNVEIGMAVLRPAEFIILKFSHKMQES